MLRQTMVPEENGPVINENTVEHVKSVGQFAGLEKSRNAVDLEKRMLRVNLLQQDESEYDTGNEAFEDEEHTAE